MTRRLTSFVAGVLVCAGLAPAVAHAQAPAPAPAPTSGLQITELENGFVIAPDVRFTKVNDRTATLAGAYAGWMTDHTIFIGAAGYWLANRDRDFKMQHGGVLVRWTIGGRQALAFGPGFFLGLGTATLSRPYGELFGTPRGSMPPLTGRFGDARTGSRIGTPITAGTPVRVNDDYVVAEPQLNAVWTVTPWMRLDVGATYRFIGASDLLGHQLRGPSGTVAIQFGGR